MDRIRFANQLRGIAALGVACAHLIAVYWALPDVVSAVTATPFAPGSPPGLFWWVSNPWVNLGPIGVGLFFLISGLVVPFSLDRHTRLGFLAARALRIFPTYAACLLLGLLVVTVSAHVWHRPLPFDAANLVGNLALVYDLLGQPSLDLVNWTLSVELKFYLLVALLAPSIRGGRASTILLAGLALCLVNVLLRLAGATDAVPSSPAYTASSHSVCLIFMLMGVLFNFHHRDKIGGARLLGGLAALAAMFVVSWLCSVWRPQYPLVTSNYACAFVVFGALYALRHLIARNRMLDAMAAISFPFYVLHTLLGFSLLRTLMAAGLAYYPALLSTVLALALACALVHRFIEQPTQRLGRTIGRRAGPIVTRSSSVSSPTTVRRAPS